MFLKFIGSCFYQGLRTATDHKRKNSLNFFLIFEARGSALQGNMIRLDQPTNVSYSNYKMFKECVGET
jgi:hypothetical protein